MTALAGRLRQTSEARGIGILRIALVPVALLSVSAEEAARTTGAFPWVMAGFAVYAAVSLVASLVRGPGGPRPPRRRSPTSCSRRCSSTRAADRARR